MLDQFYNAPLKSLKDDNMVIVDYSQIVISTLMATMKPNEEIDENLIRHIVLNTIRHNVIKFRKEYPDIVIAVDNAKKGYWRRKVAHYYKKSRAEGREKSEWDWDTIFKGMASVKEELIENFPYTVIDQDYTEADDIIGVLVERFSPVRKILIVSSDGDFTQLHNKNVKQWSPMGKKFVKPKNGSPRNDLIFKILKGDKKDGIAPLKCRADYWMTKKEGERAPSVTKKELLAAFDHENPIELYEKFEDRYKENERLLDLTKIPQKIKDGILNKYEKYERAPRSKIYPYMVKMKLSKLTESISDF